eukprot:TRINITY_DN556_c0_g1_i6.p1 TRINITY_DN556_c0_g1~~TRINITY_DN556_c0_g1_i6.p1  ORF type:complete len:241 (+),score=32.80 TRINITY_DN556_c0_g1_i6:285-1007(+)
MNCDTSDSSFLCSCDAPPFCHSKRCCPSGGGIENEEFICIDGNWKVSNGFSNATVSELSLQQETMKLETNLVINNSLQLRSAFFELTGNLMILPKAQVLISGHNSSILVNGCLQIGSKSLNNTLTLLLTHQDSFENHLIWEYFKVKDECIEGDWGNVVVQSFLYQDCFNYTLVNKSTVLVMRTQRCKSIFPKQAILGIIFGTISTILIILVICYIFKNPAAYQFVFPGSVSPFHSMDPEY